MLRKRKKDESPLEMKAALIIALHGGYWLISLLLLSVVFAVVYLQIKKSPPDLSALLPLIVLCVAPNVFSFYAFYFLLFTRFLVRQKIFALVISGALVCLISAFFGVFLSPVFFGFEQPIFSEPREFFSLTASLFLIAAIHGAVALTIRGFITWYAEIKLKEQLARKNFEMEMALVKSQINPHFLFNTINNIDVLITKNARLASVYLNRLSEILRYMVYEAKSEKIPLARELDYIEKYLELQKIRTSNPDYINFEVTGEMNNLKVTPMIFFPFIENAFKHTESKKKSGSVRIKFSIEKDRLVFECENPYQKNAIKEKDFGGVGNELIKKRLELTYPEKHQLEIADADEVYRVKLTLYEN